MPKLAIQEDMLPGQTVHERLSNARHLGLDGVEFWADRLDARLPEIADALAASGMAACGVNLGQGGGWLAADFQTRQQAIDAMRQAMTGALDLEAEYVSFVPHYGPSDLPDLTPYAAPTDLQNELMIWLLRTVSDLADALDTQLAMQPVNHYETDFMTRVKQAGRFRKKVSSHPQITIAPNLYHMALEETDLLAALHAHQDDIGVIYLADSNRRLPGHGFLPFADIGKTLKAMKYEGWLVLECGQPGSNQDQAFQYYDQLPDCRRFLQANAVI